MPPWTGKGSHCLFCTFRPLLSTGRTFATTASLSRSAAQRLKASKRKAQLPSDPLLLQDDKPKKTAKKSGTESTTRSIRQGAVSRNFPSIVASALHDFKLALDPDDPLLKSWSRFERYILNACKLEDRMTGSRWGPLRHVKASLQQAYIKDEMVGLRRELEHALRADDITHKYSTPKLAEQKKVADLRYPAEWYPQARSMQRTIHLHVGPTNSGKTYHALKRLEEAKRGFYAGPLRLLAQEVYTRMNAKGISCGLITGDDVRFPEDKAPRIISNTVEMVTLGREFEVGVIDEIQMIADPRRGWAWTRAVLGARAMELHLCGEARAVPLIRELCALTGDTLKIHRYDRLNPLKVMDKSLRGDLKKLQKGDCIVSFSRLGIHALKAEIEKVTGRRAAIIYGSLPAEIRTQQANLFNDPDNDYDFLVASDAIGMGLNLSCKRIIFETLIKRVPGGLVRLTVPEIKQIAGRAGRYRSAASDTRKDGGSSYDEEKNIGLVTSLEEVDLPYIQQAMSIEPPPIPAAGIFPPDPVLQKFAAYFPPNVPFQYILKRLLDISQVHPLFFMCDPSPQLEGAEIIDTVQGLRIDDQLIFIAAPIYARDPASLKVTRAFARCVAEHSGGRLLDIPEINLEVLEKPVSGNKEYLHDLERLHRSIILYSWLSFRFGGVFTDRTLAGHVKELVEERMIRALTEFSENKKLRKDASLRRQISLQKQMMEQKRLLAEATIGSTETDQESLPVDLSTEENDLVSAESEESTAAGEDTASYETAESEESTGSEENIAGKAQAQ